MSLSTTLAEIFNPAANLPETVEVDYAREKSEASANLASKTHVIQQLKAASASNNQVADIDPAKVNFKHLTITVDNVSLTKAISNEFAVIDAQVSCLPQKNADQKFLRKQLQAVINANKILLLQRLYTEYLQAETESAKQQLLKDKSRITDSPEYKIVLTQVNDLVKTYQALVDADTENEKHEQAEAVKTSLNNLCETADKNYSGSSKAVTYLKNALKILAWVAIPTVVFALAGALVTIAALGAATTGPAAPVLITSAAIKTAAITGAKVGAGFGFFDGVRTLYERGFQPPTHDTLREKLHGDIRRGVDNIVQGFAPT